MSTETIVFFNKIIEDLKPSKIFVLVDENSKKYCLPILDNIKLLEESEIIEIESGEKNKSIHTIEKVWDILCTKGADRNSLLINLGGGIIGDMGGFIASTFKRGFPFINVPTTLLSQVDASIGGKTGFNFHNLKNEIGLFSHPKYVIINSLFLKTLDKENIYSGWAEMIKHALIFSKGDWENLQQHNLLNTDYKALNQLIARSIQIKNHFVEQDPTEKGVRKALNFGHTFGHAFESLFMNTPNEILHGMAVAHGIICELYLSEKRCHFDKTQMKKVIDYIINNYGKLSIKNTDFEKIAELLTHDKKNENSIINITLLNDFGKVAINQSCSFKEIIDVLNWYEKL
ncbi:MAG: 3-dehydroquinate synthase [Bacteroidetes bacterium GWF2_33_16]|nr:MAG: 3-dehydroquinate synthase [Bacteroidetes bacterium GWE2_32_14]OFY04167.1 MAG: 3-dehydroquinate synthase [Bacteroidetes bacterium GWF2_33_16]